jgi:hypothetical protein
MAKDAAEKAETPKAPRPNISILERRAKGVNLRGQGAPAIQLKEDGWVCRWFNSEIKADHIWYAKAELGWVNVTPAELADPEQIGGFQTSPDGFVVRGEKGREVLLKMPSDFRKQIEKAKSAANIAAMDPYKQKAEVANAAGKALGDQAGEFINNNVSLIGGIKTTKERIAVTPEA